MTEYVWGNLRDHAIAAYGDAPGAALEQRILDVFRQHPQIVAASIDAVATRVAAGKVRSGWAVLATECERATSTSTERATDTTDRTKATARTRQRMHAELMHYDRPDEVHDELFGDRGQLRTWPDMADDIHTQWEQVRPMGEQIETEAEERANRYIAHQHQVAQALERKRGELDAKQADIDIPF